MQTTDNEGQLDLNGFAKAAYEACCTCDAAAFECPLCHATATAMRSHFNGHIRAVCSGCGTRVEQ